jgi:hypothetical protein
MFGAGPNLEKVRASTAKVPISLHEKLLGRGVPVLKSSTYAGLRSPHKVCLFIPLFAFKVAFGERQGSTSYRGCKFNPKIRYVKC